jgi:putative transposase
MVTGGTYRRLHLFGSPERLTILHDRLLTLAEEYEWMLQAWAVYSNHYHFIGDSPADPGSLREMVRRLHWETAVAVNDLDHCTGRKVWFNYWDTHITFEKSFFARLNYVHYNPQKHGIVQDATEYPWCSAAWFEKEATPGFVRTIKSFGTDQLRVPDDFEPQLLR